MNTKYEIQMMPTIFHYENRSQNQFVLHEAMGRIKDKNGWSERDGLEMLSIELARIAGQDRFKGIFFADWSAMTDEEGRTIRKQLHNPNTVLRSWDLLRAECLVAQSLDEQYARYVHEWKQRHLRGEDDNK